MSRWHHVITSCAVAVLAAPALGGFLGFQTVLVDPDDEDFEGSSWTELGYDGSALDTWRVYAAFSSLQDRLLNVGDYDGLFATYTTSPFFNAEHGSIVPPRREHAWIDPELLWDTFVTIGATVDDPREEYPDGVVQLAPTFIDQVGGLEGNFEVVDTGWYVYGFPPEGDPVNGRVLVAQFTVPEGAMVEGLYWHIGATGANGHLIEELAHFHTGESAPLLALLHVPGDADSIQEAMGLAPDDYPSQIQVGPGLWAGPIDFMGKMVTLVATDGPEVTTIDAGEYGSAVRFAANEGQETVLEGFTIIGGIGDPATDGSGELVGGGLVIDGSAPRIVDCMLLGNTADRGGGAFVSGGSPTFEGCSFVGGSAGTGGAVSIANEAAPSFVDCVFTDNAADDGGAAACYGATAAFEDCRFEANIATFGGGAISGSDTTVAVTACSFELNQADGVDARGGAITTIASNLTVDLCVFDDNVAAEGGAVAGDGSPTTIVASTFMGNIATDGGAVAGHGSALLASACEFHFNRADARGGAIFGADVMSVVEGCDFRGNTAASSGDAIENAGGGSATVTASTFCGLDPWDDALTDGGDNAVDFACTSGVGSEENGRLGDVLANAGDVDGDGFDDIIVGAPHDDRLGTESGRAFVYSARSGELLHSFGNAGQGDRFGWAVAGLGDIDGDGFADVAVGAPFADNAANNAGRVAVYSGATGQLIRWHTYPYAGDRLGTAIAGGFDLSGDGVPDYVVGAPFNDEVKPNAGKIIVYSGATGNVITTRRGQKRGDRYGSSLAMLERANADGRADILVGAPYNDQRDRNAGKAYLLSGWTFVVLHAHLGRSKNDRFGTTVASLGDVDGDGRDDYAVGAPWNQSRGRVDVFSGKTGDRLWVARGEAAGDRFGWALAGVADMDGDGRRDVVIGAPRRDVGGASTGRAYLYSAEGDLVLATDGLAEGDRLGTAVAACNDLSGDGLAEAVIGVPGRDLGVDNAGRVEMLLSSEMP